MLNMRERSQIMKEHPKIQSPKDLGLGDIVYIKDLMLRGTWRIGKIIEFLRKQGGQERA